MRFFWTFLGLTFISLGYGIVARDVRDRRSENNMSPRNTTQGAIQTHENGLGSLSAAQLMPLCFDEDSDPSLAGLERVDGASENVDVLTLARYMLREIFLNPAVSTTARFLGNVPLKDEILSCGPSVDESMASVGVLAACKTAGDVPDVEFLIEWNAQLTCTNELSVVQGSVLDVTFGSVLLASSSGGLTVEKVFVIPPNV